MPREQLGEATQVSQTVRQYLVELEQQNPTEEPVHEQDQVSTTDLPVNGNFPPAAVRRPIDHIANRASSVHPQKG